MTTVFRAVAHSASFEATRELEVDFLTREEAEQASSRFVKDLVNATGTQDWTADVRSLEKEIKLPKI